MTAPAFPVPDAELSSLARRLTRGDDRLADEAAQHVRVQHWRGLYDPARCPFRAWAYWCIRRYRADALASRLRAAGGDDHTPDRADPTPSDADFRLDLIARFAAPDVEVVRRWTPRDRIVLLGWPGLFGKLPALDQERTLTAARVVAPFPVADFLAWPDGDRTAYIATALRVRPNTVTQIRRRGRDRLVALRFVRELAGDRPFHG